jgi:voltage-gated potassium channel Kch
MIALLLAQGGEFGLLMLQTIKTSGINAIPSAHGEILSAIIILSIMTTPILLWLHTRLQRSGKLGFTRFARALDDADITIKPDVVICGFGRVGQIIAQMLASKNIPYVAIDLDVNSVMAGRERGFNVVYGDTTNADVLREFGVKRGLRGVVVALDNAYTARKTVLSVKSIAPRMKIFARARNLADSRILLKEGVLTAMPETIESSFFLGHAILLHMGVSEKSIERLLDEMRANQYDMLDLQISDKQ